MGVFRSGSGEEEGDGRPGELLRGRLLWAFSGYHGNSEGPTLNKRETNYSQDKLASRSLMH